MILIHDKKHFIRCKESIGKFMFDAWYTNNLLAAHVGMEVKCLIEVIEGKMFVSQSVAEKFCELLDCYFDDVFELVHEECLE